MVMAEIKGGKTIADYTAKPVRDPKGSGVSIGPGIGFSGAIEGADTLTVETKVDLAVKCRVLVVSEEGHYSGSVDAELVEVRGNFDGDLTARNRLIVHDKGAVSGTIKYKQIEVADGAVLNGVFDVLR